MECLASGEPVSKSVGLRVVAGLNRVNESSLKLIADNF